MSTHSSASEKPWLVVIEFSGTEPRLAFDLPSSGKLSMASIVPAPFCKERLLEAFRRSLPAVTVFEKI
jgi:hypothetical protein